MEQARTEKVLKREENLVFAMKFHPQKNRKDLAEEWARNEMPVEVPAKANG